MKNKNLKRKILLMFIFINFFIMSFLYSAIKTDYLLVESTASIVNNLGVGTTNPSEKLEVNGNVKATSFLGDGTSLTGIPTTDYVNTKFNNVATSTTSLNSSITNLATSTTTLNTTINSIISSTGTLRTDLTTLSTNTTTKFNNVATSTTSLNSSITNLATSTTTLNTTINNIISSTGTLRTDLTTLSTNTNTKFNNVATSTTSLNSSITNLATSTTTLNTTINSIISSTGTLLKKAGDTMTGTLNFGDNVGILGVMGSSDRWRVLGSSTSSDAGYLEIATADNGNEPIYFRQYSGVFTTLTRTFTLLDGSGNTFIPGNVGIGKTTATTALDVNGTVTATSFSGSGASLTGVAKSSSGVIIWTGTQAQYDAIGTKDSNTLYFITE